jgi:hypothetical protein
MRSPPGNPVRLSDMPPAPAGPRPPWLGEHTEAVLSADLGLDSAEPDPQQATLDDGSGALEAGEPVPNRPASR